MSALILSFVLSPSPRPRYRHFQSRARSHFLSIRISTNINQPPTCDTVLRGKIQPTPLSRRSALKRSPNISLYRSSRFFTLQPPVSSVQIPEGEEKALAASILESNRNSPFSEIGGNHSKQRRSLFSNRNKNDLSGNCAFHRDGQWTVQSQPVSAFKVFPRSSPPGPSSLPSPPFTRLNPRYKGCRNREEQDGKATGSRGVSSLERGAGTHLG